MQKFREWKNDELIIFKDAGDKRNGGIQYINRYLKDVRNEQSCLRNGVQVINKYCFKYALYKVNKKERKY